MGVWATGSAARSDGHVAGGLPVRMVRRWLPAGEREGLHTHAFVELCHVQSGRGLLTVDGKSGVSGAHTLAVVPPGTSHALAADNGWACGANLLHFEPDVLPTGESTSALQNLCRLAGAGHGSVSLRGGAGQAVEALLARVGVLSRRTGASEERSCRTALGDLCQRLLRQVRDARVAEPAHVAPAGSVAAPGAAGSRPEIDHVLAYIEQNLTRPISRQDLARQAAFAPSYFSALFREATGTTIPEYINARRVLRAQDLLRDPQTRVSAVCYAVGFRDLSNFNRVFKRLVGQTPREYRRAALGDDAYEHPDAEPAPDAAARD